MRLFFLDMLPSVEMKFTKQQFAAWGPFEIIVLLKSNAKMKTTSGVGIMHSTMKKVSLALSLA